VDSYHLEEKLGEGGFGSVFRARRGGQSYAVKFLSLEATDDWGWRQVSRLEPCFPTGISLSPWRKPPR